MHRQFSFLTSSINLSTISLIISNSSVNSIRLFNESIIRFFPVNVNLILKVVIGTTGGRIEHYWLWVLYIIAEYIYLPAAGCASPFKGLSREIVLRQNCAYTCVVVKALANVSMAKKFIFFNKLNFFIVHKTGPVPHDKRLLMLQCDIETLIHCTGKWRFRSAQHWYVAASFSVLV